MNLRPRRSEDPEINLISLIDILLVLVLFFLLSTTFSVDGRLRIRLPQASSVPPQRTGNEPLIVTVTSTGSYLVNGRELVNASADTLRAAILKIAGERRDLNTSIRADGRATHQSVVTAMDILGQLGFAQLNIVTTKDAGNRSALSQAVIDAVASYAPGTVYRRLLGYVRPHWRMYSLGVVGMLLYSGSQFYTVKLVQVLAARLSDGDHSILKWLPLLMLGLFVLRGLGDFMANYYPGWVGRQVIKSLRSQLFAKYMTLPTGYYDRESSGQMLTRLTYNIELLAESVTNSTTVLIRDSITVIGLIGFMFYLDWQLTCVSLLVAPVIASLVRSVNQRLRRYSTRIMASVSDVTRVAKEALDAHRVVKVFNAQRHLARMLETANESNRHSNMRLVSVRSSSNPIVQLISVFGLAAVLFIAWLRIEDGSMLVKDLATYLTTLMLIPEALKRLMNIAGPLQQGIAGGADVFAALDTPGEPAGGTLALARARGEVEFRGLCFAYGEDKPTVLKDINLRVPAGSTVAIVGRSGSGKSTLVSLLPRFYDPVAGQILLDGVDIREYSLHDLRAQMSMVNQEIVVFDDTIRNNIIFGAEGVTDAQVDAAAFAAHVSEFVEDLPQKLDTPTGDRGMQLSGGQRQRIAIARALLRNSPLLILDEATSSLDTAAERHIQAALEELVKNRTTFVIAHRLSTIEHADLIVVMQDGRIVETGTHAELLARAGVYATLHRLQFNV